MNKAYRYRLYPTIEQEVMFAKTFGCARFIYNKMLSDRLDYYKATGKNLNNSVAQYKSTGIHACGESVSRSNPSGSVVQFS